MIKDLKKGQILKNKPSERYIKIIAVNDFINKETKEKETFSTYYWCTYGLIVTDLAENIERDYEYIE